MIAARIDGSSHELRAALQDALLPVDDLTDDGRAFYSFTHGNNTVAFGGFELYGQDALLRSLVVLPQARGKGLGRAATETLLDKAFEEGARQAWLLTTSAAPFFEAAGFTPVARDAAPPAILSTRQAAALCPSTAALLARPITRGVS